jgi:glycosyltransferase involved in cell wall biosynthesis
VLTVSTLEPRKNYPNLIRAWERVVQRHDPELKLVIVANRGWREDVILREMAPHVRAGRILHLQDVPREELAALARAATCFAFPSFGEGFGYPPLEAMQAGTPAVVSDIPVFRWLLGDAALFVDPYDVEAIAAGIARLVDGGNAGAALRADLLARAPAVLARVAPGVVAAHWAALLDTVRATPKVRAIMPSV